MAKKARKKTAAKSKKQPKPIRGRKKKARNVAKKKSKPAAKKKRKQARKPRPATIRERVSNAFNAVVDTLVNAKRLRDRLEPPELAERE